MKFIFKIISVVVTIALIVGVILLVGHLAGCFRVETDLVGEEKSYEFSDRIDNLSIDVGYADITIQEGPALSVKTNHKYVGATVKNGTLTVSEDKSSYGINVKNIPYVLITLPRASTFSSSSIKTGAGSVKCTGLESNTATIDLGAGNAEFTALHVQTRAKISGGAGNISLKNAELNSLDLTLGTGKTAINGRLEGFCTLECGVGALTLNLNGSLEDYTVVLNKGIGKATINGAAAEDGGVYGSGANEIRLHGGVGEIEVLFSK